MNDHVIITILCSIIASAGFWGFFTKILDKKSAKSKMIMGIGHNMIMNSCLIYIKRGKISQNEYEDLYKYMYTPYKAMGGNGSVDRMMREVDKLPIISDTYNRGE